MAESAWLSGDANVAEAGSWADENVMRIGAYSPEGHFWTIAWAFLHSIAFFGEPGMEFWGKTPVHNQKLIPRRSQQTALTLPTPYPD